MPGADISLNSPFTNLAHPQRHEISPLPLGERARVRGQMQQTDLSRARARNLRQIMTPAERKLWHALRNRRFMGLKVRRQVPIGPYIADFYCAEHRLVIEADGGGHGRGRDAARDRFLAANGLRTLRLWNSDILCNLSGALDLIAIAAQPIDPRRPI